MTGDGSRHIPWSSFAIPGHFLNCWKKLDSHPLQLGLAIPCSSKFKFCHPFRWNPATDQHHDLEGQVWVACTVRGLKWGMALEIRLVISLEMDSNPSLIVVLQWWTEWKTSNIAMYQLLAPADATQLGSEKNWVHILRVCLYHCEKLRVTLTQACCLEYYFISKQCSHLYAFMDTYREASIAVGHRTKSKAPPEPLCICHSKRSLVLLWLHAETPAKIVKC